MPRLLVTGSREFTAVGLARTVLWDARRVLGPQFTVDHGGARGADLLLAGLAKGLGLDVQRHRADWDGPCRETCRPGHRRAYRNGGTFCPAAGDYRNQEMVDLEPDLCAALLVAGWPCKGTRDCAARADAAGIPVRWYTQETR